MPDTAGDLLALLRSGRARTRADLVRLTGLSRTAVLARLDALADAGLVAVGDELASTGGRRPLGLHLVAGAGVVLAAAVGRSRSQVAVVDLAGTTLAADSRDHEVGAGPEVVMASVAQRLEALLASPGGAAGPPVLAVGLSLPGPVDTARGSSRDSPVMTGWDGVPLAPFLADLPGVAGAPLVIGNDADVLAAAEQLARPDLAEALVVKASTGLGLGLVVGGRRVPGVLGAAGEIGHVPVPEAAGRRCRCGRDGCLEAVAGGWALVAEREDVAHVRDLVALALAGEERARDALARSARLLGEVLATAVTLLNPAAVVLGGDMAAAYDLYADGVGAALAARGTALATRDLQVLPAAHGDRAGLVGCAALALDHALAPRAVDALLRQRVAG